MNLIEQLGGYEKCAEYRWALNKMPDVSKIPTTLSELLPAMLQHRRENNIFEEGDYVFDDEESPELMQITIFYETGSSWCFIEYCHSQGGFDALSLDGYRHATPEEIKAGHRL